MAEEMVTITKKRHEALLHAELHLLILERRGVDNWDWYCGVPHRPEGMTDKEYDAEIESACSGDDNW